MNDLQMMVTYLRRFLERNGIPADKVKLTISFYDGRGVAAFEHAVRKGTTELYATAAAARGLMRGKIEIMGIPILLKDRSE